MDTIFALSSGRPPAAIAIMRISGLDAHAAARSMAGTLPPFRTAAVRTLRDTTGSVLDRALVLAFDGPATATGEDLVELHLHGGRAVVAAVESSLSAMTGLRPARAGEFTRRALENGRVDLAQAQGLADLLSAETEGERRAALAASDGAVGRTVTQWNERIADASAQVEAALDYSDEGDVSILAGEQAKRDLSQLIGEMRDVLARPTVERLRDGALIVLAGPPNAGKSSLFNALLGREAAIVTDIAGTTRDAIEASVVRGGEAYRLVDTAGLAERTADVIEAMGIERAGRLVDAADLILWCGQVADMPARALHLLPKSDLQVSGATDVGLPVSAFDRASVERLWNVIADRLAPIFWQDDVRLHDDQHRLASRALTALGEAEGEQDLLIVAERLRDCHRILAELVNGSPTDAMLDALFSRFCVGK